MTDDTSLSAPARRLYDLLPAVHRIRDLERGEPLLRLLAVVGEQLQLVDDDIAQLYENWFIETCEDWVVPYLGDLVGYRPTGTAAGGRRTSLPVPRRSVANAVRSRRRKGTLPVLAELAADLADWPARAVETYQLLSVSQPVHLLATSGARPQVWGARGRTVDLWDGDALRLAGTPFDTLARTVDVRRPQSHRTPGRHSLQGVTLFVWRLRAYTVTGSAAARLPGDDRARYTFSAAGNDTPLFARRRAEAGPAGAQTGDPLPVPLGRRELARDRDDLVGEGRDLDIQLGRPPRPLRPEQVVAADLGSWAYQPLSDTVVVDPQLGRMLLGPDLLEDARRGVVVSYAYGFGADIGGGEYERPVSGPAGAEVVRVRGARALRRELAPWLDPAQLGRQPRDAVIEILDSGAYDVAGRLHVLAGHSLQLRAATRRRPVLRVAGGQPGSPGPGPLRLTGGTGSRIALDGLLLLGEAVQVEGDLAVLTVRHCTFVPGGGAAQRPDPDGAAGPSLRVLGGCADVDVEHSILGAVEVAAERLDERPPALCVADSILDATKPGTPAVSAPAGGTARVTATFRRVTVIGEVRVQAVELAENTLFTGTLQVERRQDGCLRFCSVIPGSGTPRRFQCQPDLVDAEVDRTRPAGQPRERARARERARVRPALSSTQYGSPDYCQLAPTCAPEITRGADDESELGVFHDLYQPQRTEALRAGLDEYTPADVDAGIIFAT